MIGELTGYEEIFTKSFERIIKVTYILWIFLRGDVSNLENIVKCKIINYIIRHEFLQWIDFTLFQTLNTYTLRIQ